MLYFLLTLLAGFLGALYLFPRHVERPGKRFPGPPGLPMYVHATVNCWPLRIFAHRRCRLGCLLDFTPTEVLDNLKKHADRYGPSFELVTLGKRSSVRE
jgi:hypothetical protein